MIHITPKDEKERRAMGCPVAVNRRRLLSGFALAPFGALPGIATAEPSKHAGTETRTLKLHSAWPSALPVLSNGMRLFADTVHALTGGAVRIDIVTPEQHGRSLDGFDAVRSGEYAIAHTASYYHTDLEPDALFLSAAPFGMILSELSAYFTHDGDAMALVNEVYARHGIEAVTGGNTGMQMGGWFRERLNSIDDLKGLRMRIPGAGGQIMSKLGVESVTLGVDELFDALATGRVDAVEFIGPSVDLDLGLHLVAPYYYTGWQEPATELFFLFDSATLATLTEPQAAAVRIAAEHVRAHISSGFHHANSERWASVKKGYPDIRVTNFPVEIIDALRVAYSELADQERARSEFSRRLLDNMDSYLANTRRWTEIGDWSYIAEATS